MVNIILFLMAFAPAKAEVYGSIYPKDSTTTWCAKFWDDKYIYACLPNPLGSGNGRMWIRFPDSTPIEGCINGFKFEGPNLSNDWIWLKNGPPAVSRLTLDVSGDCLRRNPGVTNRAKPGDSIDVEYKWFPIDTAVADTSRGWFKAFFRGNIITVAVEGKATRRHNQMIVAGSKEIVLESRIPGSPRLYGIRGREIPVRIRRDGRRTYITPEARLMPGVYRIASEKEEISVVILSH